MNVSFYVAPGTCDWVPELYRIIQSIKDGSFDSSEVYSQFAYLIVPEVVLNGADGPFSAYLGIQAPDANNAFSFLSPIREIYLWTSDGGEPVTLLLQASQLDLSFAGLLAVSSAKNLEKLMFRGDDRVLYLPDTPDTQDDVVRTWDGNDDIDVKGSGGTDRFYGGDGNDRITIVDFDPDTLQGVDGAFFGYGDAGNDTIQGDQNDDHLFGGGDNDSLTGNAGDDEMSGGKGNDLMTGGVGDDTLDGGGGDDVVYGTGGRDLLTGGKGADTFVFFWNGDTGLFDSGRKSGARDVITDFDPGTDPIRLIEGSPASITLIGSDPFTAPGQVRWTSDGTDTTIFINADADAGAEMAITVLGVTDLGVGDFIIL